MNPSKIITWKLRLENEGGRGSWNSWWSILSLQEIAYHLITAGHHDRSNISNRLGTETSLPLSSPCRYSQFFCLLCHNRDSDLLPSPSPRLTLIQVGKWPTRLQKKTKQRCKNAPNPSWHLQHEKQICWSRWRLVDVLAQQKAYKSASTSSSILARKSKRADPGGNRTPNLSIWSRTRCHCATKSTSCL